MVSIPSKTRFRLTCLKPYKDQYCRTRQLPRLLKMWPGEVEDYSYPGTLRIAALLRKALRAERRRARASHPAYDLTRHMELMEALKAEGERLQMLQRGVPRDAGIGAGRHLRREGTLRLPHWEKNSPAGLSSGS
jgi:hypothetical protein